MSARDHGGPAAPVQDCSKWQCHGMTLRDYFAAKAMQGLLAAGRDAQYGGETMDSLAMYSYVLADYMLKARSQ